ncbi:hypothetical protein, partial [Candidatus Hodgkinia cicadicola]|uniref:hypothetical protein n=1 Tax=Candidatus Hodgkinia cicadicola TaxID=573658 RepID=UPI0024157A28
MLSAQQIQWPQSDFSTEPQQTPMHEITSYVKLVPAIIENVFCFLMECALFSYEHYEIPCFQITTLFYKIKMFLLIIKYLFLT